MINSKRRGISYWKRLQTSYVTMMIIPHHEGKAFSFRFSHLMFLFLVLLFSLVLASSLFSIFEQSKIETMVNNIEKLKSNNIMVMKMYRKAFSDIDETLGALEKDHDIILGILSGGLKHRRGISGVRHLIYRTKTAYRLQSIVQEADSYSQFIWTYKDAMANYPAGWPASGRITSYYGYRLHPILNYYHFHRGLDIGARMDSPVYATANGIIQKAEYNSSYGNFILINHKYGYSSLYGHNSKIYVYPGQKVYRGQVIGKIGNTGLSTGPHVHYEVLIGNYSLNPIIYMGRWF